MIKRDSTITVNNNVATLDNDIYLYKYDKNIQITFTIVNSKYMYDNDSTNNLVANAQASYAQVKFKKDDDATNTIEIEFDIQATKKGAVILTISEELTDEDTEIGDYSIQIRLLDSKKEAVLTLPPIKSCIHIQQPLFEKLGTTNVVDDAVVDQALTTYAAPLKAVEDDGTFAKKTWVSKEKITTAELNRMEDGIGYNNTQLKDIKSTQIVLEKDDTSFKGIDDTTHDTLTTTNKTIIGGINEVNSQCKDIEKQKIDDITLDNNILTLLANNKTIKTITLPSIDAGTAKEIELQSNGTYIQWRYVGDTDWTNLVLLTELKGGKGDTGLSAYELAQSQGFTGNMEKWLQSLVPNIQIGEVTTLESGSSATASITGTAAIPLLNLGIPKGADGAGGTGGSSEKEWTLIKSDTLQEECSSVVITEDSNGNPFSLNEILIVIKKIVLSGATDPTHFEVVVNDVNLVRASQAIHNSQLRNLECKISSFADYKIASFIRHSEATGISPESFGLYSNKIQGKITKIEFRKYLYNDCKLASGLQYEVYGK